MKLSTSIIAAAVVATLPLATFAGDKDKSKTCDELAIQRAGYRPRWTPLACGSGQRHEGRVLDR